MGRLDDTHSLSDFLRNTKEHLRAMKRSGNPRVLTVNGRAEVVVQDARSYQKLLDLLDEAEVIVTLGQRLATRGKRKGRGLDDAIEDLGKRYVRHYHSSP